MKDMITIYIDDKPYQVEPDQTIMQAADHVGFRIPRLCYHPKLSIEGACRVCIVEVEGMKNYVASCSYPVYDGMKVQTATEELRRARRDIVELILDNHPTPPHRQQRSGIRASASSAADASESAPRSRRSTAWDTPTGVSRRWSCRRIISPSARASAPPAASVSMCAPRLLL